jgi:hypothetical protein
VANKSYESGGRGGQHQKRICVPEAGSGGKAPGHVEIENLRDDSAQRDTLCEAGRLPANPDVGARRPGGQGESRGTMRANRDSPNRPVIKGGDEADEGKSSGVTGRVEDA